MARAFIRMAQLLEDQGGNPFRARAYRRGASAVWSCHEPIERLAEQGRLESLSGIGPDLAAKVVEILQTGTFGTYEMQRRQADPEVRALIDHGLPPEVAVLIDAYCRRGAIDELRSLAASHLLRSLPGVTRDSERLILEWIDQQPAHDVRSIAPLTVDSSPGRSA